jgi:hypothetical protein
MEFTHPIVQGIPHPRYGGFHIQNNDEDRNGPKLLSDAELSGERLGRDASNAVEETGEILSGKLEGLKGKPAEEEESLSLIQLCALGDIQRVRKFLILNQETDELKDQPEEDSKIQGQNSEPQSKAESETNDTSKAENRTISIRDGAKSMTMFKSVNDSKLNQNGLVPLHVAAKNGHLDLCMFLVDFAGAIVDIPDVDGEVKYL